jgi:hypothetical protein
VKLLSITKCEPDPLFTSKPARSSLIYHLIHVVKRGNTIIPFRISISALLSSSKQTVFIKVDGVPG